VTAQPRPVTAQPPGAAPRRPARRGRALITLFAALALACAQPAAQPGDVRGAMVRFDVALDRALEAHDDGDAERAREAWREAHQVWDATIGPGLAHIDPREVVALELHLARIRAAIDGGAGDPGGEVRALREGLASPLASLPKGG
jgi:hypothetical protein